MHVGHAPLLCGAHDHGQHGPVRINPHSPVTPTTHKYGTCNVIHEPRVHAVIIMWTTSCRPRLTQDGLLTIDQGTHPIARLYTQHPYVANDTRLDQKQERLHIITGVNMSGKSNYLRQVGTLVVMAHIGCPIPAKHATIPLLSRVLTRMGETDEGIATASSFTIEMRELAHVLNQANEKTLVLIDELGRGTSPREGESIAAATVCDLCESGAYALFATHFKSTEMVAHGHPNMGLYHFDAQQHGSFHIEPLYKLAPGT